MNEFKFPRMTAVLGPTNTGKTHLAIERMLGHSSGMIGFPLRLLARENYDRVVARKGRRLVALITGEEKIVPSSAEYFLCTVESMPMGRKVDFLAIDEIQMVGDRERGHIFSDRLLRARGIKETMLLGAEIVRPLLQRLFPDADFISRPRLSKLKYSGSSKITRLPRRSAVVAFSSHDVYVLAELVRQQRGGAAVVLGALSPRTRNAQVNMYQNGEVDYLIATDAIGMGLNMDIGHVAFAENAKFDGRVPRRLTPQELAQIAGRAGRYMNDGTFGVTGDCSPFDDDVISSIEEHQFVALKGLYWRNSDLSYNSLRDLQRSLNAHPSHPFFFRKRDADDQRALETLSCMPEVSRRADSPSRIRLLWEICQVPDFRKTLSESHYRLLLDLFDYLTSATQHLPDDWINSQIKRFDRVEGDIDTLSSRIAHIRTWTFITHRDDWVADPLHWQQVTRSIENRLSDALHEGLTQRFVDRRAALLMQKLSESRDLLSGISGSGDITVEGHRVGRLEGLTFKPEILSGPNAKPVLTAARRVLPAEFTKRIAQIRSDDDGQFTLTDFGELLWRDKRVAQLERGRDPLSPNIKLMVSELIETRDRKLITERLFGWLLSYLEKCIPDLMNLRHTNLRGAARGISFQITEALGCVPRDRLDDLIQSLDNQGRRGLANSGIRFGTQMVFMPRLLKAKATVLRALLWSIYNDISLIEGLPPAGRVNFEECSGVSDEFYQAIGYVRLGSRIIRVDMAERLAVVVRKAAKKQPFCITEQMLSLAGVGYEMMGAMILELGYKSVGEIDGKDIFRKENTGWLLKKRARLKNKSQIDVESRNKKDGNGFIKSPKFGSKFNLRDKKASSSPFSILKTIGPRDR